MEFNVKLQELRKQKGLTQEELAKALFVSRTAVSKWESGRGVPNIESLKAISAFFSVSIDELLSNAELLNIADADSRQKEKRTRDLVFGLLDCSSLLYLFLPLFGQSDGRVFYAVSLLGLTEVSPWVKAAYFAVIGVLGLAGLLLLALMGCEAGFWVRHKHKLSLTVGALAAVWFMLTRQPYAGVFAFVFLAVKALMLIKWH